MKHYFWNSDLEKMEACASSCLKLKFNIDVNLKIFVVWLVLCCSGCMGWMLSLRACLICVPFLHQAKDLLIKVEHSILLFLFLEILLRFDELKDVEFCRVKCLSFICYSFEPSMKPSKCGVSSSFCFLFLRESSWIFWFGIRLSFICHLCSFFVTSVVVVQGRSSWQLPSFQETYKHFATALTQHRPHHLKML